MVFGYWQLETKFNLGLDEAIEKLIYRDLSLGWVCSTCGYSTRIKTNLKFHVESQHLQTSGVKCPLCPMVLQNRKALYNHTYAKHR